MRLVLRWTIHYLKHHIPGVEERKIQWIVYLAFVTSWRRSHQFRKVSEKTLLSLLSVAISFAVLYCIDKPTL